jgi:hypothetical protein
MIYKYSIENFYSIKDKVEINLVSRKSEPKAEELYRDVPFDKKVSKVIFVGGSNASGKTNILRALPFLQMMFTYVDYSDDDAGYRPFFTRAKYPSELSVEFSVDDDSVFNYLIRLDTKRILYETLTRRALVEERTSEITIYERVWEEEKEHYKLDISDFLPTIKAMTTLQEVVDSNVHASMVAVLSNFEPKDGLLGQVKQYWDKIDTNIQVFGSLETNHSMYSLADKALRKIYETPVLYDQAIEILKKYDIGVSKIEKKEKAGPNRDRTMYGLDHVFGKAHISCTTNYESSGTQKMLILLEVILSVLNAGSTAIIDELDAFLHPDIFTEIINLFMSSQSNPKGAQIIFSSQNYSPLLSLDKQQIILVEKNKNGETDAWRLDEIEGVRADDNFYTKYLTGAYGAVPRIG